MKKREILFYSLVVCLLFLAGGLPMLNQADETSHNVNAADTYNRPMPKIKNERALRAIKNYLKHKEKFYTLFWRLNDATEQEAAQLKDDMETVINDLIKHLKEHVEPAHYSLTPDEAAEHIAWFGHELSELNEAREKAAISKKE